MDFHESTEDTRANRFRFTPVLLVVEDADPRGARGADPLEDALGCIGAPVVDEADGDGGALLEEGMESRRIEAGCFIVAGDHEA